MRWLFDTGIWLNLADSSNVMEAVDSIRRSSASEILAAPVTLAESVSVLSRRGRQADGLALSRQIQQQARVPAMTVDLWERVGTIHAAERARVPDLRLADAMILAVASQESAKLLTTDRLLAGNTCGVKAKHVPIAKR